MMQRNSDSEEEPERRPKISGYNKVQYNLDHKIMLTVLNFVQPSLFQNLLELILALTFGL